jgi:hypothetical protein
MSTLAVDKATNVAGTQYYSLMFLGTSKSTTGTSVDFAGIPPGVKRMTVTLTNVSSSGSSIFLIRLGPSGSYATTGYVGATANSGGSTSMTTGFGLNRGVGGSDTTSGNLILVNPTGNTWIASGTFSRGTSLSDSAGSVTLSSVLSQVRLTTVNGTDTFDAGGFINILYEGYNV